MRAVDLTMLTTLSAIASKQAAPIEKTMQKCLQFSDYAASQEDAIVTYQASNMRLAIHSKASTYLNPRPGAEPAATCSWQAQMTSDQQWSSTQYLADDKGSNVISHRGH
jgi:hypothetical protein